MKFVHLTRVGDKTPVYVNLDLVNSITLQRNEDATVMFTTLWFSESDDIDVTEAPEEILAMIDAGHLK